MHQRYILNDKGEAETCDDIITWGRWFAKPDNRIVAKMKFPGCEVSTVFLGIDYAFGDEVGPILWETMVFGGPHDEEQDRCSGNRADAQAMHDKMVARVKVAQL